MKTSGLWGRGDLKCMAGSQGEDIWRTVPHRVVGRRARRAALAAARGASLAVHAAAGLARGSAAIRLLRAAEGLCRTATAVLEAEARPRSVREVRAGGRSESADPAVGSDQLVDAQQARARLVDVCPQPSANDEPVAILRAEASDAGGCGARRGTRRPSCGRGVPQSQDAGRGVPLRVRRHRRNWMAPTGLRGCRVFRFYFCGDRRQTQRQDCGRKDDE